MELMGGTGDRRVMRKDSWSRGDISRDLISQGRGREEQKGRLRVNLELGRSWQRSSTEAWEGTLRGRKGTWQALELEKSR